MKKSDVPTQKRDDTGFLIELENLLLCVTEARALIRQIDLGLDDENGAVLQERVKAERLRH